MKKLTSLLLLSAALLLGVSSCKKYEEGPTFSLASKKARVEGDWTIEKATITQSGSTDDATEEFKAQWTKISFTKDGSLSIVTPDDTYTGTWEFDDKKENLLIAIDGDNWTWEIIRLKSKELWIKWNYSGIVFDFQFQQ